MPEFSGITRSLMWLRKVLQITQKTDSPRVLSEVLDPIIDVFGWERLNETVNLTTTSAVNQSIVSAPAVPDDVLRLVLEANVETTESTLPFTMWIDHLDGDSNITVGVMRPIDIPISTIIIRCAMQRQIIMSPGDQLVGRSTPASGVGDTLSIRQRFVDLPIGEYIRGF